MSENVRRATLGVIVSEKEADVIRALAFIEGKTISSILYPWVKTHLVAAGERPDVQAVVGQKARVEVGEKP